MRNVQAGCNDDDSDTDEDGYQDMDNGQYIRSVSMRSQTAIKYN